MARHEVLLQVRRFEALVTYHPFDGLTPVEEHLVLAIAAGLGSLDELAAQMRLPRRLLLDACVDLLSIGAIEIDPEGEMVASERTRMAMGSWQTPKKGWETSFATGSAPPPDAVPLMQDTVSGSVFRSLPRMSLWREGLHRLPQDPDLPPIDEIPRPELLAAVMARPIRPPKGAKADERLPPRRARIGDVRLRRIEVTTELAQPSPDVAVQSLPVDLLAVEREGRLPPRFSVLGPSLIPSIVRSRIGTALGRLWERGVGRGESQVFEVLSFADDSASEEGAPGTELPEAPLARLEQAAEAAGAKVTEGDHERLLGLEREAIAAVSRAVAGGARASLVVGALAHHEALAAALGQAKQQVVMACPWVTRLDNPALREQVAGAVRRGVNVFLLWGIARDEPLPPAVASLRDELAAAPSSGAFRVADRSSQSHAKLLVCDHDWAIVTSCNYLSSGPDRVTEELGVRLTSPPPFVDIDPGDARTAPSHPISELLRWSRLVVPDYRVGRLVYDEPILFGLGSGARRLREPPQILPPDDNSFARQLWHKEWTKRVRELRQDLDQTGTYAFAVDSAAHREVLFDAIATARRRLLIESPKVNVVATSPAFVRMLEEARARGVDVAVRYAEREPAGPEGDSRWDGLVRAGMRLLQGDTHAKLLVADDWLLAGSFNFLSFEGRSRRELGIQVADARLANDAAARFAV
jgi:phosphatidylserine/phosphatidylglycerophosphate/cardiolipin synthase-like enzyme